MGSNKKRQQTINKRNRERAIEEKRTLKRERKQAMREAARNGEPFQAETPETPADELASDGDSSSLSAPD